MLLTSLFFYCKKSRLVTYTNSKINCKNCEIHYSIVTVVNNTTQKHKTCIKGEVKIGEFMG